MHRILLDQKILECPSRVRIDSKEEVHHAVRVLRLVPGDQIELSDSEGREVLSVIRSVDHGLLELECLSFREIRRESAVKVTLYQGLPKHDKLEFIIQKAVELGAVKIVPVVCERSVAKIRDDQDASKKTERWNRIAHEAAKQSKRTIEPEVGKPVSLKHLAALSETSALKLLAYEGAFNKPLATHLETPVQDVSIFVGPEGGLTEREVQFLESVGFKTVGLGPRILRTETAGLAMLAIVQFALGDMGGK